MRSILYIMFKLVFLIAILMTAYSTCGGAGVLKISILGKTKRCSFDERCFCKHLNKTTTGEIADCSKKRLHSIPKTINSDIESINLSNNFISTIPENIFQNSLTLLELDLSHNIISVLFNGSFNGLGSLQTLKLNGNQLRYKDHTFEYECFRPLVNLRDLNIENNTGFYTAGQKYPPIFSDLLNLENLSLDGVNDEMLGNRLLNLTNLKSFKISNLTGVCNLKKLESNIFNNTPNLEIVEITACPLKEIPAGTFRHLENLTKLDLSYNIYLHFERVGDALNDLRFTSIKILKLNKIYETFHLNVQLPRKLFEPLKNTSLRELEMDSNRIQIIEIGALPKLPATLLRLSASDNCFSFGHYLLETQYLTITVLNVSNQFATHNFLNGNIFKRHVFSPFSLREDIPVSLPLPKHLKKLLINRSNLRFPAPKTNLSENNLEHIDFSQNLITPLIGPFLNTRKVRHVDFSQNYCSNISNYFFIDMISIETLLLNDNLLGFIIPEDEGGKILSPLHKLKVINLSQNRISFIPFQFFKSQESLLHLDLSYNLLSNVTFNFKHMHRLKYLDLSYNQIQYLPRNTFQALGKTNINGKLMINLIGNSLVCNCHSIKFIEWLFTTKVAIEHKETYKCLKDDTTIIDLKDPKLVYKKLLKDCSNFGYLIVALSVGVLMFMVIVVVSIAYRYRWKLRYLYYMAKQKYRGYNTLPSHDITDFLYDAFISYADEDRSFVHNEMLEQLENNFGFKLCLHKRDFLPGNDIAENIANAIHKSKKTIVVMSSNFLKSYWCMFEFNMARMESMYSRGGEKVLFLIMYEQIPTKDLPLRMLELIQVDTATYAEYSAEELETEMFWLKIKEALKF